MLITNKTVHFFFKQAFIPMGLFCIILSKEVVSMGIQKNMADMMNIIKQKKGISMVDFSEELEISCSALQDYLNAQGNPTIQMVEHLAYKLGLDPITLMAGLFEPDQVKILLILLDSLQGLSHLSPQKRRKFAELLQQMIQLWDDDT